MDVQTAILQRHSVRAYLEQPVPSEVVKRILSTAHHAPSGVNTQPWHVAVLTGSIKKQLSTALIQEQMAGKPANPDLPYYPAAWFEPYKSRRKACGLALYGSLNIGLEDTELRKAAWLKNYDFFGAPVGLLFFIEQNLGMGAVLDTGMFMQNIMLAALNEGLGTCPQAALAEYPHIVRQFLPMYQNHHLLCGMSLGYPDESAAVNLFRTCREPLEQCLQWFSC